MQNAKNPILVVGGRTTGLMMAAELARHGMPVRIIDKSPGIDPHSRATLLHSRTLEILDSLGLAEKITSIGQPMRRILLHANGRLVSQSREDNVDSPFPHGIALSQAKTEAVLENHLKRFGVKVERNTELVALNQTPDGIRATIHNARGKDEVLATPWLIGCDGAHSTVRRLIGIDFPGEQDHYPYLLADVILEGPRQNDDVHIYLDDRGDLFFFVLDEGRCLVVATGQKNDGQRDVPTLEEMQQMVTQRSHQKFRLTDPRWLTCFQIQYRLAPHYRQGRVFLAGDAAHIHSLIGGHGMNTGIQDAHNLAWKLTMVQLQMVPEHWLDSYEIERRQVAEDVIAITKSATQNTEMFAELAPEDRAKLCKHMFAPESEKQIARRQAEELDLDYRTSPICLEPRGEFDAGPSAGGQAPDAGPIFVGGRQCRFFDLLGDTHHKLVLFSGSERENMAEATTLAKSVAEKHWYWIKIFMVTNNFSQSTLPKGVTPIEDPNQALRNRYAALGGCLYLIRPDGYIAFRSRRMASLDEYLAHVLVKG